MIIKKILFKYIKKTIKIKPPNDILINKKKICGILQETIFKSNKRYLIVGIGINLVKSPYIKSYPTTNLYELVNKYINKSIIEKKPKLLFEKNLSRMYRINKLENL